jgi:hypothetical protein
MSVYFVNKCSICHECGMVIAVMLADGSLVAQCDECGKRYLEPESIGSALHGFIVTHPLDIHRAATLDDITRLGWDRVPWEKCDTDISHYFPSMKR